jgi:hypothetical protein
MGAAVSTRLSRKKVFLPQPLPLAAAVEASKAAEVEQAEKTACCCAFCEAICYDVDISAEHYARAEGGA